MRKTMLAMGAAVLLACGTKAPVPTAQPTPSTSGSAAVTAVKSVEELGRRHVEHLAAGEHAKVYEHFDDTMKGAMSLAQLAELWPTLIAQAGPLKSIEAVRKETKDELDAVIVTCAFEKAVLDIRVVLDPGHKISGLFVRPADQGDLWTPPSYAPPEAIEEVELSVGAPDWLVPGTLTTPKTLAGKSGTCPGVVLVHGSGPNDRDETIGPNKPFKDLAWGLASRGICVLRYEKRTKHHGELVVTKLGDSLTIKEETVDDAIAAASALRKQALIDPNRVFVLGHSLGGHAIPRIAKRAEGLHGFIIMAGSTRPLEDLVLEQVKYISNVDGKVSPQEQKAIAGFEEQVATVKSLTAGSKVAPGSLPLGIGPAYWLDLKAHDPIELIRTETRPILALQGDRDYQVTLADFAGWEKALGGKKNATLKRFPTLNHLFIAGEGKSSPAEYQVPGHVALEVVEAITAFVSGNPP